MGGHAVQPASGAIEEVRRLAGSVAAIRYVTRLEGGQHSGTWRVDTEDPAISVVVRQFPVGDDAAACEQRVLRLLGGLGVLAPVLLGGDVDGRWSERPTSLISWLDGLANITPSDPRSWAAQLGHALAAVHDVPIDVVKELSSVLDGRESQDLLSGPLATEVRSHYAPLGRPDLNGRELRSRHSLWTTHLLSQGLGT